MDPFREGENWPRWSTPQREIQILRAAIHAMAADYLEDCPMNTEDPKAAEQGLVDQYVAAERTRNPVILKE